MDYVVIKSHPNMGGYWVGTFGDRNTVIEYLKTTDLDYIYVILELKENGEDVSSEFLEWDDQGCCFSGVKV